MASFTYCEKPETVCSGSALGKAPEHSVMDTACWGRALCHPHLASPSPSWHITSWPWVAKLLSPSVWITGLRWPVRESSWYSSLQQYELLWAHLTCPLLPMLTPHRTQTKIHGLVLYPHSLGPRCLKHCRKLSVADAALYRNESLS